MPALCRDCLATAEAMPGFCPGCGSRRIVAHPDLFRLAIAHVDADAFFAAVEKRDRPDLRHRPLIVGGGRRGVVASACYLARAAGVRSAMPMFRALAACPEAVVVRPQMEKYEAAARHLRALMDTLTPLVEPLSIDEAVLDLSGTEAVHRAPPAVALARFALAVEREVGVTVSIGLAPNRLLAKLAAERDKPRGFFVMNAAEGRAWLAEKPISALPGIGPVSARRLAVRGFATLGQIAALSDAEARRCLGPDGPALAARARGEDTRPVTPVREAKSVSAVTTLESDLVQPQDLEAPLWRMAEKLARRLAEKRLAAAGVVLRLKTAAFVPRSRATRLPCPTVVPETLFAAARPLLWREADGSAFRLIGLAAEPLAPIAAADRGDLADPEAPRRAARHRAIETLRAKFGEEAVKHGRSLR